MLSKYIAGQLSNPTGLVGHLLGPLWNKRNVALNNLALESLDLHPSDRVLDVGFGGGNLLGRIAAVVTEGFVAGVDVSTAMVKAARHRYRRFIKAGRLTLHQAPVEALPFPDAHFDKVSTVNSLFYWDDLERGLSELHRVLRPGGLLVICVTRRDSLQDKSFADHGLNLLFDSGLQIQVAEAGFSDMHLTHANDKHRRFVCITTHKSV